MIWLVASLIFVVALLIIKEILKMAVTQTQFDPDLAKLGTDIAELTALVPQLIAALKAAGTPATADLTTEDTAVNSMDSAVSNSITLAKAALGQ